MLTDPHETYDPLACSSLRRRTATTATEADLGTISNLIAFWNEKVIL